MITHNLESVSGPSAPTQRLAHLRVTPRNFEGGVKAGGRKYNPGLETAVIGADRALIGAEPYLDRPLVVKT
jgi:hypothetical protein